MPMSNPFGLTLSMDSARQIVRAAVQHIPAAGVALVVTSNIDYIATIRRSPPLARAYRNVARVVCDGGPVQACARWCGLRAARVTGREITSELMRLAPYAQPHRLFFLVDCMGTQRAVEEWASRNGVVFGVATPPFGFERDTNYSDHLAELIKKHRTTLLIMAVGAPLSEVSYRSILPRCWAFSVGQAVKIELGLVRRALAVAIAWDGMALANDPGAVETDFTLLSRDDRLRLCRPPRSTASSEGRTAMTALRHPTQVFPCMVVMTRYPETVPAVPLRRPAATAQRRTSETLGARPPRVNLAGLKL
jgi:N-acetylglucosaminyldiphosphoundecaprenol N-acetyl-beta-D-mannosaminyltransferase